ncbi:uncharacterized protein KD926_008581 [Aspergillus affinis]|uniref:uncharacterized protein n=1 Tax=Aspergillus affinis TaxID=1070780 RepID=UPI0022FED7BC|nr:uncharacterized protein KD926_008581 [Aspergillus affinis]KAI9040137.1 hypothetical protein KD926_008581 [Aspergillus affinis]
MFEDFSFSSPSSTRPSRPALEGNDRLMVDCDSALISPLSSRCPSPRSSASQRFPRSLARSRSSHFRAQQAPTSVPFDYNHKRLSIATLTRKLHEHTIQNPSRDDMQLESPTSLPDPQSPSDFVSGGGKFSGYVLTPPDTDHDDEGFFDSSSLTSPSLSPQPQSPFLSPTYAPLDDVAIGQAQDTVPDLPFPDSWNVRAQRQHISRLQCNPSDVEAIRHALLSEDEALNMNLKYPPSADSCHPSSLPPQQSPRRRALTLQRSRFRPQTSSSSSSTLAEPTLVESRGRRKSSSGVVQSHRIEKNYHSASGRDMHKKSEQGLRRKSLVSAALASMVEKSCCTSD